VNDIPSDQNPVIIHADLKAVSKRLRAKSCLPSLKVHRQDNVLVDQAGRARLTDFGLSRMVVDGTLWNTNATNARGTTRWMAPELLNPELAHNTPTTHSDVYAFAMTCYVR
jgi:serine/threonine protein kinase